MVGSQDLPPNDAIHSDLQNKSNLRRRIISLSDHPDTKAKLHSIIDDRKRQRSLQEECITLTSYDDIDADIASLAAAFTTNESKSHFLGGIVRLAAHDFLDYDKNDESTPYGPDGCVDFTNPSNAGLEEIWCDGCDLTTVYNDAYSHISRADFWVAAANAVIRQTSNDGLNLKDSFVWGRVDNDSCPESAARLPQATGCGQVEDVFLNKLGLSYVDAVALIGAHTLGRGDANVSFVYICNLYFDITAQSLILEHLFINQL
jgi:hypothetical protein